MNIPTIRAQIRKWAPPVVGVVVFVVIVGTWAWWLWFGLLGTVWVVGTCGQLYFSLVEREPSPRLVEAGRNVVRVGFLGFGILLLLQTGVAVFGDHFKADRRVLRETANLQQAFQRVILVVLKESARLDVRSDYSVHAYISRSSFLNVPFPDLDAAMTDLGRVWCNRGGLYYLYLSKVVLRDIQTGEKLATYRCLYRLVSK